MNDTIADYVFATFFFLICFIFVFSAFVSLPERNDNEFSE